MYFCFNSFVEFESSRIKRKVLWVDPQSVSVCKANHTYSLKFNEIWRKPLNMEKNFTFLYVSGCLTVSLKYSIFFNYRLNCASNWNINYYETKIRLNCFPNETLPFVEKIHLWQVIHGGLISMRLILDQHTEYLIH